MRHRGSCICDHYELRVTRRCLSEDLGLSPTSTFDEAAAHPIVAAFESQRSLDAIGTKTIGPEAGRRTIYRLGIGHDHRGATWFDPEEGVVWLCAYRHHRSGDADDAFPYFRSLIEADRVLPVKDDYESLFKERGERFIETVRQDAEQLLHEARLVPGAEISGLVGGEENVGVLVEVVETLEDLYVAFSLRKMESERIVVILAAFAPSVPFSEWELLDFFPTRDLDVDAAEICYRVSTS